MVLPETTVFRRGDVNGDGVMNLADAVSVLGYLFGSALPPSCTKAADMNDDGNVDVSDPVYGLNYLFKDGPEPPAPWRKCGFDPTPDSLSCLSPPPCEE